MSDTQNIQKTAEGDGSLDELQDFPNKVCDEKNSEFSEPIAADTTPDSVDKVDDCLTVVEVEDTSMPMDINGVEAPQKNSVAQTSVNEESRIEATIAKVGVVGESCVAHDKEESKNSEPNDKAQSEENIIKMEECADAAKQSNEATDTSDLPINVEDNQSAAEVNKDISEKANNETIKDAASDGMLMEYRSSDVVVIDDSDASGSSEDSSEDSDDSEADEDASGSKPTDVKINKVISNERDLSPDREKRVKLNRYGFEDVRTKGEILPEELPPLEELTITVDEAVQMNEVGTVSSIVGILVVIQSQADIPPLNDDTILFIEGHVVLGQVFEVFGPVRAPWYSVRFNDASNITNKGLKVGTKVYCAPKEESFTKYVFVDSLKKMKGSDASWEDNNEPPDKHLEYSDDEDEKRAKSKRKNKNKDGENKGGDDEDSVKKNVEKKNKKNRSQCWPPKDGPTHKQNYGHNVFERSGTPPVRPGNHSRFCRPQAGPQQGFRGPNQHWSQDNRNVNTPSSRFGGPPRFMSRPQFGNQQQHFENHYNNAHVNFNSGPPGMNAPPMNFNHSPSSAGLQTQNSGGLSAGGPSVQNSPQSFVGSAGNCPPTNIPPPNYTANQFSNHHNSTVPFQFTRPPPPTGFSPANQSRPGAMQSNMHASPRFNMNGGNMFQNENNFQQGQTGFQQNRNMFSQNGGNTSQNDGGFSNNANNLLQTGGGNFSQCNRNTPQNLNNGPSKFPSRFKVHSLNPNQSSNHAGQCSTGKYEQVQLNATNIGPYRPGVPHQTDMRTGMSNSTNGVCGNAGFMGQGFNAAPGLMTSGSMPGTFNNASTQQMSGQFEGSPGQNNQIVDNRFMQNRF